MEPNIDNWIESFLDGSLDEADAARFWNQIKAEPELAERLFREYRNDFDLRFFAGIEKRNLIAESACPVPWNPRPAPELFFPDLPAQAALFSSLTVASEQEKTIEGPITKMQPVPRSKTDKQESFLLLKWLVPPCLILFALAVYHEFRPTTSDDADSFVAVARIVESVDAEWEEGTEVYKNGRELEPCSLKLKSGVVKVEFGSGVEVTLEGPTELLVKGRNTAFCQRGKLSADVPTSGKGFEVATPTATVVDLGTAFTMTVSEEVSEVHVIKGKVEVGKTVGEKHLLTDGLASLLELRVKPKFFSADPTLFFSNEKLRKRKAEYVARRQTVWNEQKGKQLNDPALLYRLRPEAATGLATTKGSRDDKTAIRFRSARDSLVDESNRECRSLTLLASVRLKNMKNAGNTLLIGDAFLTTPGAFHWQLNRYGVLQFHLNSGDGTLVRLESPSVVERKDCMTWMQLATVLDAERKTVSYYVNGESVSTLPWPKPQRLFLGRFSIGNEWTDSRKSTARYFNGDVEDLWIYDRPLSNAEIRDFYDNNF